MQPVVIAAGGTGGHFFPAEALASALIRRGHRVVLLTDARSGALDSPVFRDRERHVLQGAGIAGRGPRKAISALFSLAAGTVQARQILSTLEASVLVAFGGYPSVPPVLAASSLRRGPAVLLHEQNAVLGRANRLLSRRADLLALGFDNTRRVPEQAMTCVVGNPVRDAIRGIDATYIPPEPDEEIRLLVTGGSLGARVFGDVVPDAILGLPHELRSRIRLVQQVRAEDMARVQAFYDRGGIQADLSPFFADIATHLAAAHLVIARAGASTVAELLVAGRPSILVPLPGAIDDHQARNAEAVADAGGAFAMPQSGFTPVALREKLHQLLTQPSLLANAAAIARSHARPDAAEELADLVEARIRNLSEQGISA